MGTQLTKSMNPCQNHGLDPSEVESPILLEDDWRSLAITLRVCCLELLVALLTSRFINVEGLCQVGVIGSQRMHKGRVWTLDQQAKIGGAWFSLLMHQ